jgi:CubicO group peptidase (beta-lactamase class C family)
MTGIDRIEPRTADQEKTVASPGAQRDYWPTRRWRVADPEQQGMSPETLARIREFAQDTSPLLTGIVVVRRGYIVYEQYLRGFHERSYHSVYSVTKSVTSALVGAALGRGLLSSIDQNVMDFFPEIDGWDIDPRVRTITLRHLLTMTGGWTPHLPGSEERLGLPELATNPALAQTILRRQMAHEPGTHFWYDSLGMHLLSMIVARASAMTTAEFALEALFRPLGIWPDTTPRFLWHTGADGPHNFHPHGLWDESTGLLWRVDRGGYGTGCCGVHFTVRELAKFGYLYLNRGRWDGEQIVPHEYVTQSGQPQSEGRDGTRYGYLWWIPQSVHRTYYGWGHGGQYVYVVPDLEVVVAITAHLGRNDPARIVNEFVIPAVTS